MFEKIAGIISEQLGVSIDEITMDSDIMKDLDADSLDMVEVIMAVEDEYGVEVADEDLEGVATIRDVIEYLNARGIN